MALIALGVGFARDLGEGVSSEVLDVLSEHRLGDVEPEGVWIRSDKEGDWTLRLLRQEGSGRWTLRRKLWRSKEASEHVSPAPAETLTTSGIMAGGILVLDSPLDGSTRFHLCRFDGEEFLLPENTVRFENPSVPHPAGVAYHRVRPAEPFESLLSGRHVVEDLPAGTWEAVDCPEWAWLEIRPTGVPDAYRVRCSRRQGEDPTPVNSFARATWEAEVLAIDSPFFGNGSWSLRHSKEEDWLVPVAWNHVEEGVVPAPTGMRFRLVNRATRWEGHIWFWDGVDPDY